MTIFLVISLILSVALNGLLIYFSINAAKKMMNISEELSVFWASLIEYKDYLESISKMHTYTNNSTIQGFVQATKQTIKEIYKFKEFCKLSDILSEEEMEILNETEEDWKKEHEELNKGSIENEHIKEWNKERKERIQKGRQTIPPKTKRIQR